MSKIMLNMEELESVSGGNIFTDAWDWICEKLSREDKPRLDQETINKNKRNLMRG